MTVTLKSKDGQAIRKLIPLTTLPESAFNQLCSQIRIEEGPKGTVLFKQGDQKNEFVYLLSGTISLQAAGMEMDTIRGGSEEARFALAHQIPRKVFAVATEKIRFIRINADILNSTTSKQQDSFGYEVSDIPEESTGDWMTTLLKSPIFQRLPAANLQRILTSMEEVEVKAGELVVKQGEIGDYYYIIKQGRCSLTRRPSKNAKEIKLAELKTTETFGEDSLISGAPRNVNITMLTDGTLLRLSKDNFLEYVKKPVIQNISIEEAIDEVEKGAVLLDVRTPDNFERGHIEGSQNAPFFSLRMQLPSLDSSRKLIVVCEDGNTSEAATFLLIRFAFDAVVLKGGLNAVPKQYLESFQHSPETSQTPPGDDDDDAGTDRPESPAAGEAQALDEARQIITQLQKQLQEEQAKRQSVESEQRGTQSTLEADKIANEALKDQIETLNRECAAARKEAEDYRNRLADVENRFSESIRDQEKAGSLADDIRSEFDTKIRSLESELNDKKTELENLLKQSAIDSEKIQSLQQKLQEQADQIEKIAATLQEKTSKLEKEISAKSVVEANLSRIQKESAQQIAKLGEKADKAENQARRTIEELQQQLEQSRESYALLEKQKTELAESSSGEVESLLAEKQAFEKEAADLKHRIEQISDERHRIESETNQRIEQLLKETEDLRKEFEQKSADLESTQEALRNSETRSQELQEDSTREIARLKEALDESLSENDHVRKALNSAIEEKTVLKDEFEAGRRELDELKQALSESEQACSNLIREKQARESEIDTLRQDSDTIRESNEQLQKVLSDRADAYETELSGLRAKLVEATSKEGELTKAIGTLEKHKQALEAAKAEIEKNLNERATQSLALEQALQSANSRISETEAKIADQAQTIEEQSSLNDSLRKELEEMRNSRKEDQEALDALSAKHEQTVRDAENQRNEFINRIADLEQSLKEADDELANSRKSEQASANETSAALERIEQLTQDNSGLESKIVALRAELDEKTRDLGTLQQNLSDHQKSEELTRSRLNEISAQYEQSLLLTDTLKSQFQEKVEELESNLAQTTADLDETRREAALLADQRNDLEMKQEALEAENASLKQEVDNLDRSAEQVTELQNRCEQQQEEIRKLEESHALKINDAQALQARLEEEIAALKAENSEIQDRMADKAADLSAMEEKLFAIRKENAVLERRIETLQHSESGLPEGAAHNDDLETEILTLKEALQSVLDEKTRALEEAADLRKINCDLESRIQDLTAQPDRGPADDRLQSLQTEIDTIRDQAEQELQTMKARFEQSQKEIEKLEKDLKTERQRLAELEEEHRQRMALNPALTAVDGDLFGTLDDDSEALGDSQSKNKAGSGLGRLFGNPLKKR